MYKIRYGHLIYSDLREIHNYILLDNQAAADKIISDILDKVDSLAEHPERGISLAAKIKDVRANGIRFVLIKGFYVFYEIKEDCVFIYRVLHSKRDCFNILDLQ